MKTLRKIGVVVFLCLCCFGLVACSDEKKSKDIDDISYTNVKLNITDALFVGDSYDIEDYLTFSSNIDNVVFQCMSTDEDVISFIDAKTFKCNSAGKTTIRVRTPIKDGMFVTANQNVEVELSPSYYSFFSFAMDEVHASYSGTASQRVAQNTATMQGESSFPLQVEYSTDLATYDPYTGKITYIKATGNCRITVRVPYARNVDKEVLYQNYTFDLYVDRYVKNISLTGGGSGITLKTGETGTFNLNINDGNGCTCSAPTITALNSDMLSINGYNYTALSSGTSEGKGKTSIVVTYYTAHGVTATKTYFVTILDEPTELNCAFYLNNGIVSSPLTSYTEYKLKISGTFDAGVENAILDKDKVELSVYGIDGTARKNGVDIDYIFTTPSAGSYEVTVRYYKATYSSAIEVQYTMTIVVV